MVSNRSKMMFRDQHEYGFRAVAVLATAQLNIRLPCQLIWWWMCFQSRPRSNGNNKIKMNVIIRRKKNAHTWTHSHHTKHNSIIKINFESYQPVCIAVNSGSSRCYFLQQVSFRQYLFYQPFHCYLVQSPFSSALTQYHTLKCRIHLLAVLEAIFFSVLLNLLNEIFGILPEKIFNSFKCFQFSYAVPTWTWSRHWNEHKQTL